MITNNLFAPKMVSINTPDGNTRIINVRPELAYVMMELNKRGLYTEEEPRLPMNDEGATYAPLNIGYIRFLRELTFEEINIAILLIYKHFVNVKEAWKEKLYGKERWKFALVPVTRYKKKNGIYKFSSSYLNNQRQRFYSKKREKRQEIYIKVTEIHIVMRNQFVSYMENFNDNLLREDSFERFFSETALLK